ncbi:MAG: hypothetical protein ACXAB0_03780 [Candidatus Thorarchaeota archaeon]
MKRKLVFDLLLVLLILSIMPLYRPNVVDSGVIGSPRNPSILNDLFTSGDSDYDFSWTSRWQNEPQPVMNGSTIVGDHIVIKSTWDEPVESSRISIRSGLNEFRNGSVLPPMTYDEWPTPLCCQANYTWETFDIQARDVIRIQLNCSQNGDPAFQVLPWTDFNSDSVVDDNETGPTPYLIADNFGSGHGESGSYTSMKSESIAIQILCWPYAYSENMTYQLHVEGGLSLDIDNVASNPAEVVFDTYNLSGNAIVNMTLSAWSETDTFVIKFVDVSFQNYFAPLVVVYKPIDLGADQFNITWSTNDLNADDVNYYSVWLSSDRGKTYQLLSQNLTKPFFVWDSSGFLSLDYIVRIRVYSLDLTNAICRVDNPPYSYWPGDFSEAATSPFYAGDVYYGHIHEPYPSVFVTVDSPSDISCIKGSTGNQIIWTLSDNPSSSIYYVVKKDGNQYQSGFSENNKIVVSIDDLTVGVYEFEVTVAMTISDSVIVNVYTIQDDSILTGLVTGVAAGSATIIVISGVLISRLIRRRKFELELLKESTTIEDPYTILMSEGE